MQHNPLKLTVTFPDGTPTVERTYSNGASIAVDNLSKAIDYYTNKNTPCEIVLTDHNGVIIYSTKIAPLGSND